MLLGILADAGRALSNEEIAGRMGVTPGAASKIRQRVADRVRVERNGRELAISRRTSRGSQS